MNITKEDIVAAIGKMNILEIVELTKLMEEKFHITASVSTQTTQSQVKVTPEENETEKFFDVVLSEFGENKIAVIKAIRTATNLGLKEAKQLVDSVPSVVKKQLPENLAKEMKDLLEKSGASVKLA